jgi:hypothetical protein
MRRWNGWIAGAWGMAEAVLWFVVPDVFLTWVAMRRGVRPALRLSLVAVAGAIGGGLLVYGWGAAMPEAGATAMAALPGIDAAMVEEVRGEVAASGNMALLSGPRQAQPYKLYALAAGDLGTSAVTLALWTVPGRAFRFVISSLGTGLVATVARRFVGEQWLVAGWAATWTAIYIALWL